MVYYTTTDDYDSEPYGTSPDPAHDLEGIRGALRAVTLLVLVLIGAGVWSWGGWGK